MPELTPNQKAGGAAAAIIAACAVCLPLTATKEGLALKPYRDPAAIVTWCYGETQGKPMMVYTKDQCGVLLRERMKRDYAPKVLACLPQLAQPNRRHEFAALIDAAYNAGPVAVCKSAMVAHMRAGNWVTGCKAFAGWFVGARYRGKAMPAERMRAAGWRWNGKAWVKTFRGLVIRRQDEMKLCLRPE